MLLRRVVDHLSCLHTPKHHPVEQGVRTIACSLSVVAVPFRSEGMILIVLGNTYECSVWEGVAKIGVCDPRGENGPLVCPQRRYECSGEGPVLLD
jgi:hypothetical protein